MSTGKHWVTEPDQEINVIVGTRPGDYAAAAPTTIIEALLKTVELHGSKKAMGVQEMVDGKLSDWKMWTWTDYYQDCVKFAQGLVFLKVTKFKVVNILGFNA
ncbi:hypothetical protein B484DRAFT_424427, partial [Ochromonadaceae sp. CCMP2298]